MSLLVVPVAAVGMGDAMATHYEAKACAANPGASTWLHPLTHRPPLIAAAIGEACLRILYQQVGGASPLVERHASLAQEGP